MKKLSLFFLMLALCASASSWAAESGDNWSVLKGVLEETVKQAGHCKTQGTFLRLQGQSAEAIEIYEASAIGMYELVIKIYKKARCDGHGSFNREIADINHRLKGLKDRLVAPQSTKKKTLVQIMSDALDMSQLNEHEKMMYMEAYRLQREAQNLVGDSDEKASLLKRARVLFKEVFEEASKHNAFDLMSASSSNSDLSGSDDESSKNALQDSDLPAPQNSFVDQCDRLKLDLTLRSKKNNESDA